MNLLKPGTGHERKELPPNQGITANQLLEFYKTVNSTVGILTIGMEEGGPVIPLNDRDSSTFFQDRAELFECPLRVCKMLQYKTDKDMVEALRFEREVEDIPHTEHHVCDPFLADLFLRRFQGILRYIKGRDPCFRTIFCKDHGLGANPASDFEHQRTRRVVRIMGGGVLSAVLLDL